jgi:hypothetical protein
VWGLTTLSEHWRRQADAREQRTTTLRRALADYLVALDAIALELEDEPRRPSPTRLDRGLDWVVRRFGLEALFHLFARILHRGVYGRRRLELSDQLIRASSELRLIAPPEVDVQMRELEALFRRWVPGDQDWHAEWRTLRKQVRSSFRAVVEFR